MTIAGFFGIGHCYVTIRRDPNFLVANSAEQFKRNGDSSPTPLEPVPYITMVPFIT